MTTDFQAHRPLPNGVRPCRLALGAAVLGGFGAYDAPDLNDSQALAVLDACATAGIDLIDTSDDYGRSEARIGAWLAGGGHATVLTKCGSDPLLPPARWGGPGRNWSREAVLRGVARSLEALGLDALPAVQLHNPRLAEFREHDVAGTLDELRRRGWVRACGISANRPELDGFLAAYRFEIAQVPWSLLDLDRDLDLAAAQAQGCFVIARGITCQALRGRHLKPGQPSPRARWEQADLDHVFPGDDRLAVMIRAATHHPLIDACVVGMSSPAEVAANLAAFRAGPMDDAAIATARQRLRDRTSERSQ